MESSNGLLLLFVSFNLSVKGRWRAYLLLFSFWLKCPLMGWLARDNCCSLHRCKSSHSSNSLPILDVLLMQWDMGSYNCILCVSSLQQKETNRELSSLQATERDRTENRLICNKSLSSWVPNILTWQTQS